MMSATVLIFTAMKRLVLFSVVIAASQLYHTNDAFQIKMQNEANVKGIEEELYAELLRMEQKSSLSDLELLQDEIALEQTNALCNDTEQCNCKLKYATVSTLESDAYCFVFNVSYCEGPCRSIYRYFCICKIVITFVYPYRYTPIDHSDIHAEPEISEDFECCLSTVTSFETFTKGCVRSDRTTYLGVQQLRVPLDCHCSSSTPCPSGQ